MDAAFANAIARDADQTVVAKHGWTVEDPAYRDVDAQAWLPGRFEERVRRSWNKVTDAEIRAAGGDLRRLAETVCRHEGGDVGHVVARLERLAAAERGTLPPRRDPLLRPGAGPDEPPPGGQ